MIILARCSRGQVFYMFGWLFVLYWLAGLFRLGGIIGAFSAMSAAVLWIKIFVYNCLQLGKPFFTNMSANMFIFEQMDLDSNKRHMILVGIPMNPRAAHRLQQRGFGFACVAICLRI